MDVRNPPYRLGLVLLLAYGAAFVLALPNRSDGSRREDATLRSALIYPAERIALRMNHAHPAHAALPCVRCHEAARTSRRVEDSLIPREETCNPCHADRTARENLSDERCGYCHVDFGTKVAGMPRPSEFATARLHFDHARHVRAGMNCLDCHGGIAEAKLGTRQHLPTMKSCFACHGDGPKKKASGRCDTCHLTRPDGRLRTAFPEGTMNPPAWLAGMHHDRDFLVRHRWIGADQGSLCASCHREKDCTDCHDGRVRPTRVHPGDYLTVHAQPARRNEPRCTSCHATQTFCTECHARLGISSLAAPRVRTGDRYHPPGDVWIRGPVQHALEARRSMTACASCHAERDCVQCHGALGIGAGFSPHPPGFASRCGELLRQNDRACRTCHGDAASLALRCR